MIERDKKLDYFERISNWTSWSIFRVKLVRFVKINKNILIFFQYVPRPSVGVQQQQQQQQTNNRANNVVSASAANARTRKGRQTELLMAPPVQPQPQPPPPVRQQQQHQLMPPPQPPQPQDDDQNEPDITGKGGASEFLMQATDICSSWLRRWFTHHQTLNLCRGVI